MALRTRKANQPAEPPPSVVISLAQRALACLQQAAARAPEEAGTIIEERVIWQPDSWLIQRIWQALADGGAAAPALTVAGLAESRAPLARAQAVYRLAQFATQRPDHPQTPDVLHVARQALQEARPLLFGALGDDSPARAVDRLLIYGAAAARLGDSQLALACIERADQFERTWDRVMVTPELRGYLAEIVAHVGLHPLTAALIGQAVRRYEETGAQFIHQVAGLLGPRLALEQLPRRQARLLQRCVDTFRFATLTNITARRLAAAVFGQAGLVNEVLDQLTTIANVQIARRESGLSAGKGDPHFLRQVKRPAANPDVDFQVYTLQEAVKVMPVRALPRTERVLLADRLAALAILSDGWTAAGAVTPLIEIGALKYAVDVVDRIPPTDPTRSEGVISLVRALLTLGDAALAEEQVNKALAWLKSLDKRNPERATIWGLAEVYLDFDRPEMALRLLDQRRPKTPTWRERMERLFGSRLDDDGLRDNRLRFRALLKQGGPWGKEHQTLYEQLCLWAPRLLEGEALIVFYLDGLLRPLLAAGRTDLVWPLLPQIRKALSAGSGDRHTLHVQRIATLLAEQAAPREAGTGNGALPDDPAVAYHALTRFVLDLLEADAEKGLWQTIHALEGSLPLLLALEGPTALLLIAQMTAREGGEWAR